MINSGSGSNTCPTLTTAIAVVASALGMGDATATTSSATVTRIHNAIPTSIFATARLTPKTKPTTTADIVTANVAPFMAAVAAAALAVPVHNAIFAATTCANWTSSNAIDAAVLEAVTFR